MLSRETQCWGAALPTQLSCLPWTRLHDVQEVPAERGFSQFSSTTRTDQLPPPLFQPLSSLTWD